MHKHYSNDLLSSQSSPDSEVFPQSHRQLWAGEVGQLWAQLPLAEPMASPEVPSTAHYQQNQYYNSSSHYSPTMGIPKVNPWVSPTLLPGSTPSFFSPYTNLYLAVLANQWLLPHDFPPHTDSILAELFPLLVARHTYVPASVFMNPLSMVQSLRKRSGELHLWDIEEMPTMFAYAHVAHNSDVSEDPRVTSSPNIPVVLTRFGVSAPRETHLRRGSRIPESLAGTIRAYRIRKGWGLFGVDPYADMPPKPTEIWHHGHCAEMQAIPPVVEWCEYLGLENVVIYSLSVHKSGRQTAPMCSNCCAYVRTRVLKKHPSWRVVDVHTGYDVL